MTTKVRSHMSNEDWNIALDTVNEIGSAEDRSYDTLKAMYHSSLAKYYLPGLFKD